MSESDKEVSSQAILMLTPRVGGGADESAWVGGSNLTDQARKRPKSTLARRPTDFKSACTIESKAIEGLPEARQLGADEKTSKISLTSWVNSVRVYMEDRGLDTVFRIEDAISGKEVYLLDQWGLANQDLVETWVESLKTGVTKKDGTINTPCTFDLENLEWSGKAILKSITLPLWESIERDQGVETTGPEAFTAIINKQQQVNASSVRSLIDKLGKLKLIEEPGQDVNAFGDKVTDLCRRIVGTGSPPADLTSIVAARFLGADVLSFNMKAITMHDLADENRDAITWEAIILKLKNKYILLESQGLWTPKRTKQENSVNEFAAMTAAINSLTTKVSTMSSGESGIICHHCQKPGHIKPNCPDLKQAATQKKENAWKTVAPAEGEPETKVVDGVTYSFCKKPQCSKWQSGDRAHETSDHKSLKELSEARESGGAPAASGMVGQLQTLGRNTLQGLTMISGTMCQNVG